MYILIEYSDSCSDTSGSLWQFKRDEINNNIINDDNAPSFKYKANVIGDTVADGANRRKEGVKIAVPIKYLSNFWRSLEMPLFNCKVDISLKWIENCILTINPDANNNINKATFTITDAKLYVPIVTLKTEDNTKLSKLLSEGFKRSMYWYKYKVILNKIYNENDYIRELLDASYQGAKRLFIRAYGNAGNDLVTANSHRKYFLPRIKIENCNIEIGGRNFYDGRI